VWKVEEKAYCKYSLFEAQMASHNYAASKGKIYIPKFEFAVIFTEVMLQNYCSIIL
jgi:hypothetical protein